MLMETKQTKSPLLLTVLAVIIIAGIVGFMVLSKKSPAGPGPVSPLAKILKTAPVLNANCALKDAELCKYMNQAATGTMFTQGFSGTSVNTDAKGKQISTSIFEMAGDKSRFTTTEGGKTVMETISIGGTTYIKDEKENVWWKQPEVTGKTGTVFNAEEVKKNIETAVKETESTTSYKNMGKEACGTLQCFKYLVSDKNLLDTKEYLYFDDREYLMRKMRIEMKDGSVSETTYSYGAVTIDTPSPVKEGLPGGATLPGAGEIPSDIDVKKLQEELKNSMKDLPQETAPGAEVPSGEGQ